MNTVAPGKLMNTKWTAVEPVRKEKHFVVTEVEYADDGSVVQCSMQAVMTKRAIHIDWRDLKDNSVWKQGWS